jgi:hypothetical protein
MEWWNDGTSLGASLSPLFHHSNIATFQVPKAIGIAYSCHYSKIERS